MPAFDTLKAARELEAAGFDQAKAEALARAMRQVDESRWRDLATKAYVLHVVMAAALANAGLTVALLKLFP